MKKILRIIVGILTGVVCLFSCEVKAEHSPIPYTVQESCEKNSAGEARYTVRYPEFEDSESLNAKIQELVTYTNALIAEIKTAAKEVAAYTGTDPSYWVKLNFEEPAVSGNYINILFSLDCYQGGAQSTSELFSVNYNRKTKTILSLEDVLLPKNKNWLKILSRYCVTELLKKSANQENGFITDRKWVEDGAGENAENFAVFTIEKDSVTVYFQSYQVCAYVYGRPRITVPFTAFEK